MNSRPTFATAFGASRTLRARYSNARATLALGSLPIIGALLLLALILR